MSSTKTETEVSISVTMYYIPNPVEVYVFIDEEPSGLPDNAILVHTEHAIKNEADIAAFVEISKPYFLLGAGA